MSPIEKKKVWEYLIKKKIADRSNVSTTNNVNINTSQDANMNSTSLVSKEHIKTHAYVLSDPSDTELTKVKNILLIY
jgi:hypothetical protein